MAVEIGFEEVIAALPQLDAEELADVMDRASSLLKKAIGGAPLKKKGVTPHQLEKNHEWTKYVLGDAIMNGWESFVMKTSKMNKETDEKEVTEVLLRESVETEGGHVFADTGKSMSQGQAMCYGKLLRDQKHVIWEEFETQYEQVAPRASVVKKVVKKTSQEVQEEKAAEKKKKEEEKARKAAEKEAEKQKKEEEKKKKEEEKAAKKKPVSKVMTIVPRPRPSAAAPVAVAVAVAVEEDEMPALEENVPVVAAVVAPVVAPVATKAVSQAVSVVKKKKEVKEVKEVRPAMDPFKLPEDATHNLWLWKEITYMRDGDNYIWMYDAKTEEQGDFKGRYNYEKDEIEECDEPQFVEDEEELDA